MTGYHLSRLASSDLDGIWTFIARDNPTAARATIARILAACEKLCEFPEMGAIRDDLAAGLRSFPIGRYLILYRPRVGGIQVARVVHGARNLNELFGL